MLFAPLFCRHAIIRAVVPGYRPLEDLPVVLMPFPPKFVARLSRHFSDNWESGYCATSIRGVIPLNADSVSVYDKI